MIHTINMSTRAHDQMIDITKEIKVLIRNNDIHEGTALIYCPHTTAGIAVNENTDPDVRHDVLMLLDEIYPWTHPKYRHNEGNSAAHLKAIFTGSSQTIIIENGKLVLGRWQSIYFCEFDGPRQRSCYVKFSK